MLDTWCATRAGGQGLWPAHWMMPNDASCDPDEGEMDILEMIDGDGIAHGTYHWQTTWPQRNCSYPTGHESMSGDTALYGARQQPRPLCRGSVCHGTVSFYLCV